MMSLRSIVNSDVQQGMPDGSWLPALPLSGCLRWRLRDAWEVIMDRAVAVQRPECEEAP